MLQDASCSNQPHRLVRVNNDLGANYMIKGDYAKALEQYQQTFDVSLSDYQKAVENYERAADLIEQSIQSVDVNERFNRLVFDPLYIRNLDLTMKSSFYRISSIDNQMLDSICEKILPLIHHQVTKLACESQSIERILTVDYPQLYSLSLTNFKEKTFVQYFTGNTTLRRLLNNQITDLIVEIKDERTAELSDENKSSAFPLILSLCKRLRDLTFCEQLSNQGLPISIFKLPSTSCMSSTLTKLKIDVNTFDDCLYLLDGRFEYLSTLIVDIVKISISRSKIDNTKKLIKLKHFSLTSIHHTIFYDKQVVPLLHRMSNLEELTLSLSVLRSESTFIDGNHLYDEILVHMPRLNKFTFSIITQIVNENIRIDFPSNDDIQLSFTKREYNQVDSYADFNSTTNIARCGIFNKVRHLIMTDTSAFEHKLFKLVSQDFPCLEHLY
ncbi:unnamed protein product, partial [Rotaria sp. Silwood2]